MPKKVSFFGQNFQLQRAIKKKNLPLVERSHTYERVQLVEYYQKTLVTYLDHSGNQAGAPWTDFQGVYIIQLFLSMLLTGLKTLNFSLYAKYGQLPES